MCVQCAPKFLVGCISAEDFLVSKNTDCGCSNPSGSCSPKIISVLFSNERERKTNKHKEGITDISSKHIFLCHENQANRINYFRFVLSNLHL